MQVPLVLKFKPSGKPRLVERYTNLPEELNIWCEDLLKKPEVQREQPTQSLCSFKLPEAQDSNVLRAFLPYIYSDKFIINSSTEVHLRLCIRKKITAGTKNSLVNTQLIPEFLKNVEGQQKLIWLPLILDWFARKIQQPVCGIDIVLQTMYFHIQNH